MMNVFYAHSTFRESIYKTFENICDNADENKVKILDVEENNNLVLLEKIKESINNCDIFVHLPRVFNMLMNDIISFQQSRLY